MPDMNGMDMSALEDMMGGAGMPDMSQMFGGGLKGKIGEFAMKQAMKRQANKIKKAKRRENNLFFLLLFEEVRYSNIK